MVMRVSMVTHVRGRLDVLVVAGMWRSRRKRQSTIGGRHVELTARRTGFVAQGLAARPTAVADASGVVGGSEHAGAVLKEGPSGWVCLIWKEDPCAWV